LELASLSNFKQFTNKLYSITKNPTFAARNSSRRRKMANHKSALKRIRSSEVRRVRNRYQHKTTRTAIKGLRAETDKKEAEKQFPVVVGMLDKLAKNNIIHKNKAANLKSQLALHINAL
jgi:small subunit ribosomal protein S20